MPCSALARILLGRASPLLLPGVRVMTSQDVLPRIWKLRGNVSLCIQRGNQGHAPQVLVRTLDGRSCCGVGWVGYAVMAMGMLGGAGKESSKKN